LSSDPNIDVLAGVANLGVGAVYFRTTLGFFGDTLAARALPLPPATAASATRSAP
jgi:hypothetical protein